MRNIIKCFLLFSLNLFLIKNAHSQKLQLGNQIFELHNVKGEIIQFQGSKVLKIERDLSTLIFQTADANEGMTAFVEKRPAIFKDH